MPNLQQIYNLLLVVLHQVDLDIHLAYIIKLHLQVDLQQTLLLLRSQFLVFLVRLLEDLVMETELTLTLDLEALQLQHIL